MRIQHNIMAMNSYRNYTSNTSALAKNLEKLSSGYKINRAGDDAAGLAISEKMRAQITGLTQAQSNAKSGINLVQTAEGALTEVHDMLNRMVKLADQSANGTYDSTVDRANLQKEVSALQAEIDRIADSSNFNGINLLDGTLGGRTVSGVTAAANSVQSVDVMGGGTGALAQKIKVSLTTGGTVKVDNTAAVTGIKWEKVGSDKLDGKGGAIVFKATVGSDATKKNADIYEGMQVIVNVAAAKSDGSYVAFASSNTLTVGSAAKGLTLQIGDTSEKFNQLTVNVKDMHTTSLGIADVTVGSQASAQAAVDKIKSAINTVSSVRGELGATQNRLDHTINNLSVMTENIQDAEATIRDVDVAEEMMAYTKNNILVQSAQAMLAQANQVPQGVLQLLQ